MKTFLDFLTETDNFLSGWTNIGNDKTVSASKGHAEIVVDNHEVFGITEQEIRDLIEERNEYRKRINLEPYTVTDSNLAEIFAKIFDGQYGRFYKEGWLRWFHAVIAGEDAMEITSTINTLQDGWHHIQKLAQKYNPEWILVSNIHDDMPNAPGSYAQQLKGDDVRKGNFVL